MSLPAGTPPLLLQVRQSAGLLLKNSVRLAYAGISEDFRSFIRAALLPVLGHPSRPLRHTAGTCAVTIVSHAGLGAWPELVAALAGGLGAGPGELNRVEGALDLVHKVRAAARRSVRQQCCAAATVGTGSGQ